jgi:hypothetical protein
MSTDGLGWRKLQRHERTEHRLWPVLQRAVRDHLMRLPDRSDGVVFRETTDPIADLLIVLGCHPNERKLLRAIFQSLLADGYLAYDGATLSIRNFESDQEDSAMSPALPACSNQLGQP